MKKIVRNFICSLIGIDKEAFQEAIAPVEIVKNQAAAESQEQEQPVKNLGSRSAVKRILENLGCQVQENNYLEFQYQGENLMVDVSDDSLLLRIWDVCWHVIKKDDEDLVYWLKAMNSVNIESIGSVVYSVDDESGEYHMHTVVTTGLIPDSAENFENYFKAVLDSLFRTQRTVYQHAMQIKESTGKKDQDGRVHVKGFVA